MGSGASFLVAGGDETTMRALGEGVEEQLVVDDGVVVEINT